MKQPSLQTAPPSMEDEIDLVALAQKIWKGRVFLIRTIAISAILGVIIALIVPAEYTATSTIVPQLNDPNSKLGGLSGLAELAGISLDKQGANGADLSPIVYPLILSSTPFQLELMNTPLNFQDFDKPVTLFDYLTKLKKPTIVGILKKYTIGLPGLIVKLLRGKQQTEPSSSIKDLAPLTLTEDQHLIETLLDDIVILTVMPKDGYLSITSKLPEPLAAAQMTLKAQNLLEKYIIEFKTEKVKENLKFVQESYRMAKEEFEKAQVKLATGNDRGNAFTTGLQKVELDRLQSHYNITFSVYNTLAAQLEQAKIDVKKQTPIFTVIEPSAVPFKRSNSRILIVSLFIFLGIIISLTMLLGKETLKEFRTKLNEN
jgi:Chain length determinant protein